MEEEKKMAAVAAGLAGGVLGAMIAPPGGLSRLGGFVLGSLAGKFTATSVLLATGEVAAATSPPPLADGGES